MNTRIRELAVQADTYAHNRMAEIGGSYLEYHREKFAELIVAECAELCSDLDGGENMFSRGIRRHFGAEE